MLTPITKTSMTDKAIERIRDYIKESNCMPGSKLPTEQEFCKNLAVSRSTVREALRVLQTMGYVDIIHGKGAFVKSLTPTSDKAEQWFAENVYTLQEIYVVRRALEPLMARLAAENITESEARILLGIADETERMILEQQDHVNVNKIADLDEEFHGQICKSAKNHFLISVYTQITGFLHTYRLNAFSIIQNQKNVIEPHKKIAEAIVHHKADVAAYEMMRHMRISEGDMHEASSKMNDKI